MADSRREAREQEERYLQRMEQRRLERLERQRLRELRQERREAAEQQASREQERSASVSGDTVWDRLAECESGGDWSYNGSSGYDGGLQFLPSTWTNFGGGQFAQYAWGATREQQIIIAEKVLASGGWGQWPSCSAELGLR